MLDPKGVVCLKIHGMYFTKPVKPGEILKFVSKIVYAGKSSMVAYNQVLKKGAERPIVSGYLTFIFLDENTKLIAHHIGINPITGEDKALNWEAHKLPN